MLAWTAKIAASSAGVAAQNSGGRQPSKSAVCPASTRADSEKVPLIPVLSFAEGPSQSRRNDVFVLEAPHLDGSEIRKRIGVPPGDRVILVGINCRTRFAEETRGRGQGIVSPITFARCISALARLAQHLGSTRVVIKPHESDDMLLLQEITERHGHGLTSVARNVVEGFHNVEILAAADVVIANPSSLLAEAVCSGVPAVLLVTPDVRFFFEPGRIQSCAAFAHLTRDIDELVEVTEKLLTDKGFRCAEIARGRTGVAAFFGAPDGKSSERVAMAIADMVAEHLAGKAVPTVSA